MCGTDRGGTRTIVDLGLSLGARRERAGTWAPAVTSSHTRLLARAALHLTQSPVDRSGR